MKDLLIEASLAAGQEILNVYNSPNFEIEIKSDNSPLTKADKAANDIIMSYLNKTNIPVLSEEGKQIPDSCLCATNRIRRKQSIAIGTYILEDVCSTQFSAHEKYS